MPTEITRPLLGDGPTISRNIVLTCVGDWGQANWHKIMSWISQELLDRCGPFSKTCIWSLPAAGMDALEMVNSGSAQIAISTPAAVLGNAVSGIGPWRGAEAMHCLRGLATIPHNDRMILALDPSLGCRSFADLRAKKPRMKLIMSPDSNGNLLGYYGHRLLEVHGVSVETILSWGGEVVYATRPNECLLAAQDSRNAFTAVVQEAIMTPWWGDLIEGSRSFVPLPCEPDAVNQLAKNESGISAPSVPAGYWRNIKEDLPALDFSDFLIFCRDDLPEDIGYLLTWILVNTKEVLERQYRAYPQLKSSVGWPLEPQKMARTSIALHSGAQRFYTENGFL